MARIRNDMVLHLRAIGNALRKASSVPIPWQSALFGSLAPKLFIDRHLCRYVGMEYRLSPCKFRHHAERGDVRVPQVWRFD